MISLNYLHGDTQSVSFGPCVEAAATTVSSEKRLVLDLERQAGGQSDGNLSYFESDSDTRNAWANNSGRGKYIRGMQLWVSSLKAHS